MIRLETESTLLICSENPEDISRRVTELETLAGFYLLPRCSVSIHDLYFDTTDRALQTIRASLRLRTVNSRILITLKGAPLPTASASVTRHEFEDHWSNQALTTIVDACNCMLAHTAIKGPRDAMNNQASKPADFLQDIGLQVIQDRRTYRQLRGIAPTPHATSLVLAELAVDHVVYYIDGLEIHHHEVEIEEKHMNSTVVVDRISAALDEEFKCNLRQWDHSKLQMGEIIRTFVAKGDLKRLIDANNHLTSGAYAIIDRRLSLHHRNHWQPASAC